MNTIEPLETRIAPAVLVVNPLTATYTDVDGDLVTIKTSLGTFNNSVFTTQTRGVGDQLLLIDLSGGGFDGANLTVSVVKVAGGDGLANIGAIDSTGHDLGTVRIPGDLGQIDAGDATTTTTALRALHVRSMGLYGLATQGVTGTLRSDIAGPLGSLTVTGDFHEAHLSVTGAALEDGRIGAISVGGSLLGGADPESGFIRAAGDIGAVKIGRDLVGGSAASSGAIVAGGTLASVTIGGSLLGGAGTFSGGILGSAKLGPVQIGGDVLGSTGTVSGKIATNGSLTSLRIGGSLHGGDGAGSGVVVSSDSMGAVIIGGNLRGGGNGTGEITAGGKITSVSIGGSLLGGTGPNSGLIASGGDLGPVKIGFDVKGGTGNESGKIDAGGKLTSVSIGGSLLGGAGRYDTNVVNLITHTGQIFSGGALGLVKIGGDVLGSTGFNSASIFSRGAIAGVQIGGSLLGGAEEDTAVIATLTAAPMGAITIAHDLVGGAGRDSGRISHTGSSAGVTIGGSLIGGTGDGSGSVRASFSAPATAFVKIGHDLAGGAGSGAGFVTGSRVVTIGGSLIGGSGNSSGQIVAFGKDIESIRIGHDLLGGSIAGGVASLNGSGYIESDQRIGSVFVGGSIVSGTDGSNVGGLTKNASIRAGRDIGSLTVVGGLIGNVTPNGDSPVVISGFGKAPIAGATSDLAIGKISVGGRVEWTQIFAGYDTSLTALNADAQIGSVTAGADWIASSIVAGSFNDNGSTGTGDDNRNFGNLNDELIVEAADDPLVRSRIGSITIAGQVFGTPEFFRPDDSFGFVAEQIGALKIGGRASILNPGPDNDGFIIVRRADAMLEDAALHEVGAQIAFAINDNSSPKLVNASTVAYFDADGDRVIAKLSKPLLTAANVDDVFRMDGGVFGDGLPGLRQLRVLDLRPLASNGLSVTFTVVRSATGDGLVHVGAIESTGFDVGAVSIPGDLGQIEAGDANAATAGVAALTVRTLGRLGLDTQGPQTIAFLPDLQSHIAGRLGALTVRQDIAEALVNVSGSIGTVTIGGSLIGGADPDSGRIYATGAIGAVKIGLHLQGGSAEDSGKISTLSGAIASATVGGSILGGNGVRSGRIDAGASLGPVTIGHNIRGGTNVYSGGLGAETSLTFATVGGSLLGGSGDFSGGIEAEGAIGSVKIGSNLLGGGGERAGRLFGGTFASLTIGGSLLGGSGGESGAIFTSGDSIVTPNGHIGTANVAHNLIGGAGVGSGLIDAYGKITSLSIGGSLLGGSGPGSGNIETQTDLLTMRIGENLAGGAGNGAGSIFSGGKLQTVSIGGSVIGGAGNQTGELQGAGVGALKILGNMMGGTGSQSARILSAGTVGSIEIGGSMLGGVAGNSAQIFTNGGIGIGALTIRGSLVGGAGGDSAEVDCGGVLGTLSIGGSFIGGSSNYSGNVNGVQGIGAVKIGGSLYGGSIAGTTSSLIGSGFLWAENGRIASVSIGGSIVAGWDTSTGGGLTRSAAIRADDDIGAIVVKGSLTGNATSSVSITARGQATPGVGGDIALASLTVGGRVERAEVLVGYDIALAFTNANAQVGPVKVTGDWVASNLFGAKRIASIQIAGVVAGTASAFDAFSFQAAQIGAFKSLGFTAPLTPGTDGPIALSLTTGDVSLLEA